MHIANILIDLLMPETCFLCERERVISPLAVCSACEAKILREITYPRTTLNKGIEVLSCWKYSGKAALCIQTFKYKKEIRLLPLFSRAIRSLPKDINPEIIIPVPLHRKKLQKRGYNQTSFLSKVVSEALKMPILEDNLVKVLNTPDQTGSPRKERINNLANAFRVNTPEKIINKNILLVDDVITTGATLRKCSDILLREGARKVRAITLAKA